MVPPKEKAKELVDKFMPYADGVDRQEDHDQIEEHLENAKQCAILAVNEILNWVPQFEYGQGEKTTTLEYDYFQEVKQEIKNYDS